jgi:hypothetical protein
MTNKGVECDMEAMAQGAWLEVVMISIGKERLPWHG